MSTFEKVTIVLDDGTTGDAVAPEIISASRRTDIPAFHAEWFMHRLRTGYCDWLNPFSMQTQHVSFQKTKCIVFWTKNPAPIIPYLEEISRLGYTFYFQFTLNNYEREGLEPNLPPFEERCATFRRIAEQWGPKHLVWRWDPVFVIDGRLTVADIVERIADTQGRLMGYPSKLIMSFADISNYRKVTFNLRGTGVRELTAQEQEDFARRLSDMWAGTDMKVTTCSEKTDLGKYGISHNACIDAELIASLTQNEGFARRVLTLGKDKGQRPSCLCTVAKDIGRYDTCGHGCKYCYANSTPDFAARQCQELQGTTTPLLI